jgi:hypothetical protein
MNGRRTSLHVDENISQNDADCQPNEWSQTDCDHSIVARHNRLTTRAANLQSFCNRRDNLATRVANRLPLFRSREEITDWPPDSRTACDHSVVWKTQQTDHQPFCNRPDNRLATRVPNRLRSFRSEEHTTHWPPESAAQCDHSVVGRHNRLRSFCSQEDTIDWPPESQRDQQTNIRSPNRLWICTPLCNRTRLFCTKKDTTHCTVELPADSYHSVVAIIP